MTVSVIVNVWGPVAYSHAGYDWIPIGRIDEPATLDFDFLKEEAMKIIEKSEYKPFLNAARLEIMKDGNRKEAMKVMLLDLW